MRKVVDANFQVGNIQVVDEAKKSSLKSNLILTEKMLKELNTKLSKKIDTYLADVEMGDADESKASEFNDLSQELSEIISKISKL